jgi:hypothetical protein
MHKSSSKCCLFGRSQIAVRSFEPRHRLNMLVCKSNILAVFLEKINSPYCNCIF